MNLKLVFIDHNVWDHLAREDIDLRASLPADRYSLAITREAEFEIPPTPQPIRGFIERRFKEWEVQSVVLFGFSNERHTTDEQRVGGFNVGTWASPSVIAFMHAHGGRLSTSKKPKSKLFKQEADVALAAQAFDSVVLTLDAKRGPLRDAAKQGGMVVQVGAWPASAYALRFAVDSTVYLLHPPS